MGYPYLVFQHGILNIIDLSLEVLELSVKFDSGFHGKSYHAMFSLKQFRLRWVFFFRFNEGSARVSEGSSHARGHLRVSRVLL